MGLRTDELAREPWTRRGVPNPDSDILDEMLSRSGATIMGRLMFDPETGDWGGDAPNGQWGDDPPYHTPVFVLTHYSRDTVVMKGGTTFTFVTDGIESALAQAREAAGDKDISVAGGANTVQQFIKAGLLDEIQIHVSPFSLAQGPASSTIWGPIRLSWNRCA